jgi:hypothetical protein
MSNNIPTHVLCLRTVEDDLGVYNIAGKKYEVYGEFPDCYLIETEEESDVLEITINKNDPDFLYVYEEDEQ